MGKLKLVGILIIAVALSACVARTQGGGWMYSAETNDERATFAFNLDCKEVEGGKDIVKGQFTYHDHGYIVPFQGKDRPLAIKGKLEPTEIHFKCGGLDTNDGIYSGEWEVTYWGIPSKKDPETGTAYLKFLDDGSGAPNSGDGLKISLQGGPFAGYENEGLVMGGNLNIQD